jgi:hypothetical protein
VLRDRSIDEVALSRAAEVPEATGGADTPGRKTIPEYESVIGAQTVSLDHLIEASRMSRRRTNNDDQSRTLYGSYYPRLRRSYEERNGDIEESFVAQNIDAGAILVGIREKRRFARRKNKQLTIHLRYPPDEVALVTPEFEETLWRCGALGRRSRQLLRGSNARMVLRLMYSLIVYLLSVLDSQQGAPEQLRKERIARALATAREHLDAAQQQHVRSAVWGAQLAYCQGMTIGFVFLMAVLAAIVYFGSAIDDVEFSRILITLGAGGLGALVSVGQRLTADRLRLNYTAEHNSLRLLGAFRPILGGILGLVVYVFITGDLLDISGPTDSPIKTLYFLAAIAFLAGFSERFAQDTLTQATPLSVSPSPSEGNSSTEEMEGSQEQRKAKREAEVRVPAQAGTVTL